MQPVPTTRPSTPGARAPAAPHPPGPGWALILGSWTLLGLFLVSPSFLSSMAHGDAIAWSDHLVTFVGFALWAGCTPLVHRLVRRRPPLGPDWHRHLAAHAGAALTLILLESLLVVLALRFVVGSRHVSLAESFLEFAILNFGGSFLWYAGLVGGLLAWDAYATLEERCLRAARLSGRLAEAQLQLLRMQLQPHFLFNTLHTISALLEEDSPAAERMLGRLTELFQHSLQSAGGHEIPLRDELAFVEAYLDIERTRFHDRLSVKLDAGTDTLDALVPSLLLQPLAENAVKHGISSHAAPGRIEILCRRRAEVLVLQVRDDGPGLRETAHRPGGGLGLSNTRTRLRQLYGDGHRFTMYNPAGGGLRVVVEIPFRQAARAAGPELAGAPA